MKFYINARFLTQPITGVQRYGIEISRQIKRLNPEVVFLAPSNIIHEAIANELDVIIIGKCTGHIWEQIELPFFMRKKKLPLLNLGNTAPLLYHLNWTTIHDLSFFYHPEWNSKPFALFYNFLIPRIAHKSKQIFTVSNTIKQEIQSSYGVNNVLITFNGLGKSIVVNKFEKEKIILSVGSFNERKNQQKLIDAFLQSNLKDSYRLILVGKISKIFNDATLTAIHSSVIIYDSLNDEQLNDLYSKAEIAVSVSLYEGFGIPVFEGLVHGCKTLCSDIPVYQELYGKVAYFCNPINLQDIQQQLEHLANNLHNSLPYQNPPMFDYELSATTILNSLATYFDKEKTD